jgi:hypothetical protein
MRRSVVSSFPLVVSFFFCRRDIATAPKSSSSVVGSSFIVLAEEGSKGPGRDLTIEADLNVLDDFTLLVVVVVVIVRERSHHLGDNYCWMFL